ncbi:MAG: hypothetical protein R3B82_23180 [Sandaracinaceae bacterium]
MISGEYVVLDGAEALVVAVDRRLAVIGSEAVGTVRGPRSAVLPDSGKTASGGSVSPSACRGGPRRGGDGADVGRERAQERRPKLGLGSSSAASAAAAGAVFAWHGEDLAAHRRDISLPLGPAGHRHRPRGSGADVAAATLGGIVRFHRENAEEATSVEWPYGLHGK